MRIGVQVAWNALDVEVIESDLQKSGIYEEQYRGYVQIVSEFDLITSFCFHAP